MVYMACLWMWWRLEGLEFKHGHAGDPRRPFPQDIEMRCGFLGQLMTNGKPQPPPQPVTSAASDGDMQPPPEKKFALAG